jgi:hypothetical protein
LHRARLKSGEALAKKTGPFLPKRSRGAQLGNLLRLAIDESDEGIGNRTGRCPVRTGASRWHPDSIIAGQNAECNTTVN